MPHEKCPFGQPPELVYLELLQMAQNVYIYIYIVYVYIYIDMYTELYIQ
jgi:hypothetical protein